MSDLAIRVEHLGKQYRLGGQQASYSTFRETLVNTADASLRWLKGERKAGQNRFWALDDVSFEVKHGEAVGIIGRNGAGKSTLLKILSRITSPTRGRVDIYGRVGSLLEVGTGFHPELTGRENIFLNGAILGMSRVEIMRKFDEIVDFSGIEKFLDTPVKHYSSGMYVRLAFAVAAHLEPEILVVDEVLAVGDAEFQKKCLGKMGEVAHEGHTVLFVSHNMNAIDRLCKSCILLEEGQIKIYSKDVSRVTKEYLFPNPSDTIISIWKNLGSKYDDPNFFPNSIALVRPNDQPVSTIINNIDEVFIQIDATIKTQDPALVIGYALYDENNNLLYWSYQTDQPETDWLKLTPGRWRFCSPLPRRMFNEGTYRVELIAGLHNRQWLFEPGRNNPSIFFTIQGEISDSPNWILKRPGMLALVLKWDAYKITE